jgi:sulfatase-like protein
MSFGASNFPPHIVAAKVAGRTGSVALWLVVFLHGLAALLMGATEVSLLGMVIFLLAWAVLNCLWLVLTQRPTVAALLSLEFFAALTLLSRFKYDKLWMTVDFVDVMIVDRDTAAFLLATFPALRWWILIGAAVTIVVIIAAWRLDRHRVNRFVSLAGLSLSGLCLVAVSLSCASDLREDFVGQSYVSKFARTGVEAIHEFVSHGYLEADSAIGTPAEIASFVCHPVRKLPHIILLHDESSFDITAARGVKVPSEYHRHFQSFDGKERKLLVEGVGGPSWFTEYNVLTGLSVRSFGRFATSVTRIAAGRVYRGLPRVLNQCGYQTFSLYPFYGSFLGSRAFQTTAGITHYLDMRDLGTGDFEADSFYFDRAVDLIERERGSGPLFLYVYTVANHFPWEKRLRPETTPDWLAYGNTPDVDEYIRRQRMTAGDYRTLLEKLARKFPSESFLIVRYGDHQPQFGAGLMDLSLNKDELAKRVEAADPRYLTTYYAIDAVNFAPVGLSLALDRLDAPYLPIVLLEAAGIPLDSSFSEQKTMLQRCSGVFYNCDEGAQAKRLNRLLLDVGLIKGLY